MLRDALKTGLIYLGATALLSIYGIEVCPFLETMDVAELVGVIAVAVLIGFLIRLMMISRLHHLSLNHPDRVNVNRPWQMLLVDLAVWIAMGTAVALWNVLFYGFPFVESGLKVVFGYLTLGLFASAALALDAEKVLIQCLSSHRNVEVVGLEEGGFLSITTKFVVFVYLSVGLIFGVLLLLILKDFQFVAARVGSGAPFQFMWVAGEVAFVFAVLLVGTLINVRKYSRNLRLMFDLQLTALKRVEEGEFEASVPVVSHDEFSTIARQTNRMISGLREREHLKTVFGKYVSEPVAREILEREEGADLGGREVQVAVLFTDVRGFTTLSERCPPGELVDILNHYCPVERFKESRKFCIYNEL